MYLIKSISFSLFFFFNDTATTEIYTLSLHDALPISPAHHPYSTFHRVEGELEPVAARVVGRVAHRARRVRSEEHTSELQSRQYLVCRLLLEKKKKEKINILRTKHTHIYTFQSLRSYT